MFDDIVNLVTTLGFPIVCVIALNNKISLNGSESEGLMVIKDDFVDPIPANGVMKFICYNGVCYEISRSF